MQLDLDDQINNEPLPTTNCMYIHLRSLTLKDFVNSPTERLKYVANILSRSPHLRHLALSSRPWMSFTRLEDICCNFHSLGATPLKLMSLKLGYGFELVPPRLAGSNQDHRVLEEPRAAAIYLSWLTDLEHLTDLVFDQPYPFPIAWDTLKPEWLPNLKYLTLNSAGGNELYEGLVLYSSLARSDGVVALMKQITLLDSCPQRNGFDVRFLDILGGFVSFLSIPQSRVNLMSSFRGIHVWLRALELPNTRLLGTSVWWPRLDYFCKRCLVLMQELECLWIRAFRPTNVKRKLRATAQLMRVLSNAAQDAASNCLALRYVRIEIQAECAEKGKAIVRSWAVHREWSVVEGRMVPRLRELSKCDDKSACPRAFWNEEERVNEVISRRQ